MPRMGPTRREDLIRGLRACGYGGPFAGGKHQFMKRGNHKLPIPNPRQGDISLPLLRRILAVADITADEWERV